MSVYPSPELDMQSVVSLSMLSHMPVEDEVKVSPLVLMMLADECEVELEERA